MASVHDLLHSAVAKSNQLCHSRVDGNPFRIFFDQLFEEMAFTMHIFVFLSIDEWIPAYAGMTKADYCLQRTKRTELAAMTPY